MSDPGQAAGTEITRDDLERLGLVSAGDSLRLVPLAGGVSSDIVKVETGRRTLVVKKALPRLRVAEEWRAPVSRNRHEADWLQLAAAIVPGCVPAVVARDDE